MLPSLTQSLAATNIRFYLLSVQPFKDVTGPGWLGWCDSWFISLMEMYIKLETDACAVPCISFSKNIFKVLHIRGCEVGGKAT